MISSSSKEHGDLAQRHYNQPHHQFYDGESADDDGYVGEGAESLYFPAIILMEILSLDYSVFFFIKSNGIFREVP